MPFMSSIRGPLGTTEHGDHKWQKLLKENGTLQYS